MSKIINNSASKLPSRRERSRLEKQRRILEASRTLFAKHGFANTTVQQIADAADIASGTLFLYVRNKNELLLMLYADATKAAVEEAKKTLHARRAFRPALISFFTQLFSLYESDMELSRLFWREFLLSEGRYRAELDAITSSVLEALRERIKTAQKKSEIASDIEPTVAALHLYAIFQSTLSFHLVNCAPTGSSKKTLTLLLESFWNGLKPHPR